MKETIHKDNILDEDFFPDESSKKFFIERLKMNDSIVPHFEDRKIFDKRKGNFFIPTWEINDTKKPQAYDLFLPNDLKLYEVYTLLHTIDQTIGKNQFTSVATIATVTKTFLAGMMKSGKITEAEIVEFIKKYNIPSTVVEYIKNAPIKINSQTIDTVKKVKWWNIEEQNKYIQDTLEQGTNKLFFERGKQNLFEYMKIFTQEDYDHIRNEKKDDFTKKNIVFNQQKHEYDTIEYYLKDKIWVLGYQEELNQLRKIWNIKQLVTKEYEVAEKILHEIYTYPRNDSKEANNDGKNVSPVHILKSKQMICVGKAILWHIFLSSLWIKHKGAQVPGHSALVVEFSNKKEYYFDPTQQKHLIEIDRSNGIEDWAYIYLHRLRMFLHTWDPENILIWDIYHNKWCFLGSHKRCEEAILWYDKAIQLNSKDNAAFLGKWIILYVLKKYEEAIKCFDETIKLYSIEEHAYYLKWKSLYKLKRYEEAIESYNQVILLVRGYNKWKSAAIWDKRLAEYKLFIATLKGKISKIRDKFMNYFK